VSGVGSLENGEDVAAYPSEVGQLGVDPSEDLLEAPPLALARDVAGVEVAEGVDDLLELIELVGLGEVLRADRNRPVDV
jgi:hypothetical protein